MPKLLRMEGDQCVETDDTFITLPDDAPDPGGDILVSLTRWLAHSAELSARPKGRLGVRLEPDEAIEALDGQLAALSVVALSFPKFRDGRPFTAARLLRTRLRFAGEIRAIGDVLKDQAGFMLRCGFNAFEPADGSTAAEWGRATARHAHVYQRAADQRSPAFAERKGR